ncbi:MAG: xanthine dehydrogenase family protein molybdopterin-binding subunit [Candidatus Binataceae bacterium]
MKYIGTNTIALKSRKLVAGRGQYAGDIYLDNMLYAAFARSPYAHAKIGRIDTAAARAIEGVVKVLTPDETKNALAPLDPGVPEDVKRATLHALPIEKVRYVGEPVAAVAATDKYAARKAADLIEIDYDDLPAVVDCAAALEADSPRVQSEWNDNLLGSLEYRAGDPDRAFAEADGVVSGAVKSHRYLGTPIEPRAYVADFDPFQRTLTMWASTQHPHQFRTFLAETLGLPENSVRVIENDVGGAFGLKMPFYADEAVIAYLAMALGRPVKWVEERNESFLAGGHAREKRFHYEAAYKKDGQVTGLRVRALADVGAPGALHGWAMAMVCAATIPTVYKIPNCEISMKAVVTNKSPWAAYRGFGKENANFVMERVMDRVADA